VFTDWDPTSEVPGSPDGFVTFIEKVETSSGGPILLHCRYAPQRKRGTGIAVLSFYLCICTELSCAKVYDIFPFLHIPSDGGGQSGLFCAVAILLEKVKVEREVSVVNAVTKVKTRRPNAIHCQVNCFVGYIFCSL